MLQASPAGEDMIMGLDYRIAFVRSLWLCDFVVQFFLGWNWGLETTTTTFTTKTQRHKDELNNCTLDLGVLRGLVTLWLRIVSRLLNTNPTVFTTIDNYNLGVYERPPQRHRAHGGLTEDFFLRRATESHFLIGLGLTIISILQYYSRPYAYSVNSVSLW
jgi:hypothetical protein